MSAAIIGFLVLLVGVLAALLRHQVLVNYVESKGHSKGIRHEIVRRSVWKGR